MANRIRNLLTIPSENGNLAPRPREHDTLKSLGPSKPLFPYRKVLSAAERAFLVMSFTSKDIPPALSGQNLLDELSKAKEKRPALVEGLFYQTTLNMLYADAGCGKSTICVQLAMEMSAGVPVFGAFHVPKKLKVLYLQMERPLAEALERIDAMRKVLPLNEDNLTITDKYQAFNLADQNHANVFIECVLRDAPNADVIIIDPIYCTVVGGFKEEVPVAGFNKTMSRLQVATNATLIYSHHTTKTAYHAGEKVDKEDPFYGSNWVKAHVTGMYYIKNSPKGTFWKNTKDNYGGMVNEISLLFDGETGISHVEFEDMPAIEKVRLYLRSRFEDGETFTFNDIQAATKVCTRRLRELLVHSSIKGCLEVVNTNKNKHLYKSTNG